MATQFTDGFPNDPMQAIRASTFLTSQEQQEWFSWLTTATPEDKDELVTTLHELWKEQQQTTPVIAPPPAAPAPAPTTPPPAPVVAEVTPVVPPPAPTPAPIVPPAAEPDFAQMPPRSEPPRAEVEPKYSFSQETAPKPVRNEPPREQKPQQQPPREQSQQPRENNQQPPQQNRPQNNFQQQGQNQPQGQQGGRNQQNSQQPRDNRGQNQPQGQQGSRGQYSFAEGQDTPQERKPQQTPDQVRQSQAEKVVEISSQKSRFVDLKELRSTKTKSVLENIYNEYNKQKEDQDKVIRKVMDTVLSQEELLNYVDEIAARMITLNDSWVDFAKKEQTFKEDISNRLDDQSARVDELQSQIDMLGVGQDKTTREIRVFKSTMQKELSDLKVNYAAAAGDMYNGTDGMNEKISSVQKEIEKLKGNPINSVQGRFDYLRQQNQSK